MSTASDGLVIRWRKEDRRWHGEAHGWTFRISEHWTGFWLDGWNGGRAAIPHKCSTLEAAQKQATEMLICNPKLSDEREDSAR